jgi:hypothetical protein
MVGAHHLFKNEGCNTIFSPFCPERTGTGPWFTQFGTLEKAIQ